jgi:uncharacterized protein YdaU (DUF1376 family)
VVSDGELAAEGWSVTNRREPFLPLFVGDFLGSTGEWSGEEQSLYLLLLAHQWAVGSLPVEADKLARLCRWDRRAFLKCWDTVKAKFTERDGRLFNQRLEEHREHALEVARKRSEIGSKGGSKRAANAKQLLSKCQPIAQPPVNHQSINDSEVLRTSGAAAPQQADPRKQIFDIGVSLMGEKSRSLIGKAIRDHGEERVAEVIGGMAAKPPVDPKAYFAKMVAPVERGFVA